MFEEDKLFAYAFLTKSSDGCYLLLDYFAVCSDVRGMQVVWRGNEYYDIEFTGDEADTE